MHCPLNPHSVFLKPYSVVLGLWLPQTLHIRIGVWAVKTLQRPGRPVQTEIVSSASGGKTDNVQKSAGGSNARRYNPDASESPAVSWADNIYLAHVQELLSVNNSLYLDTPPTSHCPMTHLVWLGRCEGRLLKHQKKSIWPPECSCFNLLYLKCILEQKGDSLNLTTVFCKDLLF